MASSYEIKILIALFIVYFIQVMMRKALSGVSVYMLSDDWIEASELGFIMSAQTVGSMMGRSLSVFIIDYINPVLLLIAVTLINSIALAIFTIFSNTYVLIFIWGTSGAILGFGWPCIAKIMKVTVDQSEFATCWALVGTASNVAGVVGPIMHNFICTRLYWTHSLHLIAMTGIIYGIFLGFYLKDWFLEADDNNSNRNDISDVVEDDQYLTDIPDMSLSRTILKPIVLSNALLSFFVALARYSINDWLPIYMDQDLDMPKIRGSLFISSMELGGLIGSLFWGFVSDQLTTYLPRSPRVPVLVFSSFISGSSLIIMSTFFGSHWTDFEMSSLAFIFGASIFGPVSLSGVLALESAPEYIAGSVSAFTALCGNVGTFVSNLSSGVADQIGWPLVYFCEGLMLLVSSVLVIFGAIHRRRERILRMQRMQRERRRHQD